MRLAQVAMLGLLLVGLGGIAHAAPIAVLTDVKGDVQIVHGGATQAGKSGSPLEAGDLVRVVTGSATLFYASQPPKVVKTGAMLQLTSTGTNTIKPTVWRSLFTSLTSGFARRAQTRPLTVPSIGMAPNVPKLLVPRGSQLTPRPTFVWNPIIMLPGLDFQDYEVTVFDSNDKIVWRGNTPETFLTYPSEAPAFKENLSYSWQVVPRRLFSLPGQSAKSVQADPKMSSKMGAFTLAPALTRVAVAQQTKSQELALAQSAPNVRRLAIAAMLAERGFGSAALAKLNPSVYAPQSAPGASSPANEASVDEASSVLQDAILNSLLLN